MNIDFDELTPFRIPKLDLTSSINLASIVQAQFEEQQEHMLKISEEAYSNEQRKLKAAEETAANTAETNLRLDLILAQLSRYVDLLEKQLETQKQQLDVLNSIFASSEDGVTVEKEIMKLIADQIKEDHPLWEYVKDKGGDIAVASLLECGPVIWAAVKAYLASQGIIAP